MPYLVLYEVLSSAMFNLVSGECKLFRVRKELDIINSRWGAQLSCSSWNILFKPMNEEYKLTLYCLNRALLSSAGTKIMKIRIRAV